MDQRSQIGVIVVDDHEQVAAGLVALLDAHDDLRVLASAATISRGLELIAEHVPDVVILDRNLPDGDGIAAISTIVELMPSVSVLMLTGTGTPLECAAVIEAGGGGFLTKGFAVRHLDDAVRAVASGDMAVEPQLLAESAPLVRHPAPTRVPLSEREAMLVRELALGIRIDQLAAKVQVDTDALAVELKVVQSVLGAPTLLAAVAVALRDGLRL